MVIPTTPRKPSTDHTSLQHGIFVKLANTNIQGIITLKLVACMISYSFLRLSNHGDKHVCVYKGIQRVRKGETK